MKTHFKIFLLIFLIGIILSSCKKEKFSTLDPILPGGTWRLKWSNSRSGSSFSFSESDHMTFIDFGDSSSNEDDKNISGTARKDLKGNIKLKRDKFKIEEKATPFDTTIYYDIYPILTHWRVKIKINGTEAEYYYRE
jgi:hypothetical protein